MIARSYGVTVAAIVQANGIGNPSRIFAGQRLTIPGAGALLRPRPPRSRPLQRHRPAAARVHTVERGQNLTVIARSYGVTVAAIVRPTASPTRAASSPDSA